MSSIIQKTQPFYNEKFNWNQAELVIAPMLSWQYYQDYFVLNNSKGALAHRSAILDKIIDDKGTFANASELCSFGEDVKMVRKIVQKQKYLTPIEKDELGPKYESGQSMAAILDEYSYHYTTVGRILRKRGAVIRV